MVFTILSPLLFLGAALLGLTMAYIRLSMRRNPPTGLAMAHGILALGGIVTLAATLFQEEGIQGSLRPHFAFVLFLLVSLLGFGMASLDKLHKKSRPGMLVPKPMLFLHAGLAVFALFLLVLGLFIGR